MGLCGDISTTPQASSLADLLFCLFRSIQCYGCRIASIWLTAVRTTVKLNSFCFYRVNCALHVLCCARQKTSPHSRPSIVVNLNKQGAILLLAVNVVDVPSITCLCNKNLDPRECWDLKRGLWAQRCLDMIFCRFFREVKVRWLHSYQTWRSWICQKTWSQNGERLSRLPASCASWRF